MMQKNKKITILILIFLLTGLFFPLLQMLINVNWSEFINVLSSVSFRKAFFNSLFVTSIATIFSILLAYMLAYSLNRTNIKHKEILKILITIPMLIPSISHGLGLINLFGNNGIVTKYFDFNIIGSLGIIIGSIIYTFPVAFLMISDGFNYIDNNMYVTARVLNFNWWQTFKKVTIPYMKKPLFSAMFAVFTMIFTDYGVPLAVGGKYITLPVYLYKEVIGLLNFSTGTIVGLVLLIPAFVSFIFDTFTKNHVNGNYEGGKYYIKENKLRDRIFTIFTYGVIIIIFLIITSFIYYAFVDNVRLNPSLSTKHFTYILDNGVFKYLFNSLFISIAVSIIGTFISYFTAYITARNKSKLTRFIHILTISSLAIPGIVLGLSYTISFNQTFIYNTFFILIIVNIIHFMASPYLMAYNALEKVNKDYELVAKTLNISQFRFIKDVIIPSTKGTILEVASYFFINSMITISAITFLFNTNTMPLALLINTYEGNMLLGEAAIISLIILLINIIVKLAVCLFKRKEEKVCH